jgi:hypothetical protein
MRRLYASETPNMKRKKQDQPLTEQELYDAHTEYQDTVGELGDRVDTAKRAGDRERVNSLLDYHAYVRAQRWAWLEEHTTSLSLDMQQFLAWFQLRRDAPKA